MSSRAIPGEEGLGITGGGHVECTTIDALPVGSVVETAVDAFRENTEENKGFARVISRKTFLERVQPIATFSVRTNDANRVHSCTYFGLPLRRDEWEKMRALRPGKERKGALIEAVMTWDGKSIQRHRPEKWIRIEHFSDHATPIERQDFYHQHEWRAFGQLAWHAAKGKLWQPS
jgi:hypothetical protein